MNNTYQDVYFTDMNEACEALAERVSELCGHSPDEATQYVAECMEYVEGNKAHSELVQWTMHWGEDDSDDEVAIAE